MNEVTCPTRDGYTEQCSTLFCVYVSTESGGVQVENIAGLFEFLSDATELARSIRDGVRIVEILRLPEVTVR